VQERIAVYVASYNTRDYTELCVRSLHRYADRPFALTVGDSGSADGSAELLADLAREGWLALETAPQRRRHAEWLDRWLIEAQTELVLFCDSDIEFRRRGALGAMVDAARRTRAAIVSSGLLPHGHYEDERRSTHLMPRPAPWLMLVNTLQLRSLQTSYEEHAEPAPEYPEGSRTFDVGGLLYHRALAAGMEHAELGWRLRRRFRHYQGASWLGPLPGLRWRRPPDALVARGLRSNRRAQATPSALGRLI
jgi:GT2 family glycosyltransferase